MNYECFFCGGSIRINGDICAICDRKITSATATGLRTRPTSLQGLMDVGQLRYVSDGPAHGRKRRSGRPVDM